MTRQEKAKIIESLTEAFKASDAVAVCDYKGLSVAKLEELRVAAKEADVHVQVVKNTLAHIAFKNASMEGMTLKDTNIFIWGADQLARQQSYIIGFGRRNSE